MLKTNEIAGVPKESQNYLKQTIRDNKCKNILEIGMADGFSSVAILEELGDDGHLTSIDPYQSTYWSNNGVNNIKNNNLEKNHTLIEDFNYLALPELLKQNKKYDLIFIDGSHIFDCVILDNFYCDMLLKTGGILINDDWWMEAVKKAYWYVKNNYPHYKVIDTPHRFAPVLKKTKPREYLGWDYHKDF